MIGVTSCLAAEFARGVGLKEQVGEAPASILAVFVLISLASYVPIFRGYTRKEDFSNGPFTPKSENWNGRCVPQCALCILVVWMCSVHIGGLDMWIQNISDEVVL